MDKQDTEYRTLLDMFFDLTNHVDWLDSIGEHQKAQEIRNVRDSFKGKIDELSEIYHAKRK